MSKSQNHIPGKCSQCPRSQGIHTGKGRATGGHRPDFTGVHCAVPFAHFPEGPLPAVLWDGCRGPQGPGIHRDSSLGDPRVGWGLWGSPTAGGRCSLRKG